MNFKHIVLLIIFLILSGYLFVKNIPIIRAQSIDDLSVQISAIKDKISKYQSEMNELLARVAVLKNEIIKLQTEMAKLLGQQISIVQTQISQLQSELATQRAVRPESGYRCPDLNKDGTVNVLDLIIVSGAKDTCKGDTAYDMRGDVDGDNCITNTDLAFLQKYLGKTTGTISQCAGTIVTPPTTTTPETSYLCPDLNKDGTVNVLDLIIVSGVKDTCKGDVNYDARGDVDRDNCITNTDLAFLQKYLGKTIGTISQCQ